jgi:hypothetical protein
MDQMSASLSATNRFVLRFWLERSILGARWRGNIEHIPSGERIEFLRLEELLKFLRKYEILLDETEKFPNETKNCA